MTRATEITIACLGIIGLCSAAILAGALAEKAISNVVWTMQEYQSP